VAVDVAIAGGGTGGHTSPGLAVAALLHERSIACVWIGSRAGVEARRVPERGVPYFAIPTGKLRRAWAWQNVFDLAVNVPAGVASATRLLVRLRPRVVFATGGFVALPVVLAAATLRVPIVIHEQTTVPGLANRIGARFARRIAVTFPDGAGHFPAAKVVVTGNPLRPELRGGSPHDAVERFGLDAQVIHQCGDNPSTGDRQWLEARRAALPAALRARYTIVPYVGAELAGIYAATALLVARAGAGTLNECCQLGLPALYIPLPGTRGDEQTLNARLVERAGGAVVLPQVELTPARLLAAIGALLANPRRLKDMGARAMTLAVPDADARLVSLLTEVWR